MKALHAPALAAIALLVALGDGAGAQEEAPAPASSAAPARSAASAAEALAAFEAKVQAVRKQLDATTDGEQRFRLLSDLAAAYYRAERVGDALRIGDEIVQDARIGPGRRSLRASGLATDTALTGDFAKSQRYIARAKELAREAKADELELLPSEPAYAFLAAEAEIARRATNRHDIALAKTRERAELAWANFNDPALSDKRHRAAANELLGNVNLFVRVLVQNNRRQEAMSYVNEIRQRIASRPELKPSGAQLGAIGDAMAIAQASQDDYDAALAAIDDAIAIFARAGVPEHDGAFGTALRMRLMVALALGRIGEYGRDADMLQRGRAVNPVLAGGIAAEEADSLALATRGQWAAAAVRVGEIMARNARRQGTEGPFYKYQAGMQMLFLLSDPAGMVNEADIARFTAGLANDDGDWADSSYRGAYTEDGALAACMRRLMAGADGKPPTDSAVALAFRISELLRSNASQGALADGAARLAAGNPKLRALIEQEQLLRFEQNTSRLAFASEAGRLERLASRASGDELVAKRQAADLAEKQKALAEKEKTLAANTAKLAQLRKEISAQFPVYRELVSPNIPSAAKLGAALKPGEVYLNLYAGAAEGFAFVVQPGGKLSGQRLAITRDELRKLIVLLRKPFDAGQIPERPGELAGFDLAASHAIFKALLAPVQSQWQGARTVYVSAGGLLSGVPWNVLVTQPARGLADASWWVGQATPVQMPGASSLVLARTLNAKGAGQPFVAFADPAFDGQEAPAPPTPPKRAIRQRAIPAGTATQAIDYRSVNRLPETLDEVRAIAASLNASDTAVIRGPQASRSRVMKENLADVRVVAFATHGLLPGEVPGMLKAGLAMAYEGRGLDDSVLTIDDIVGLRLNADWVILSACNTGYASGAAGDSMSALARGFFAAGARTVLATQWAVESQSAKELTVGVFKVLAADPAASKGDALAETQRAMIAGKLGALYQHPYFWAPYFVAGDAAR